MVAYLLHMIVTMVMVSSLNGKITKGENPEVSSWASPEDQQHFLSLLKKYPLRVMGRKSYEAMKHRLILKKDVRRIVITRHPEQYDNEAVPGQLEFTRESPEELAVRLSCEGHASMLLLGGGALNTEFFKKRLVNELYLTIEPKLFGEGAPFVLEDCPNIQLKLQSVKRLNNQGTLLLFYHIE